MEEVLPTVVDNELDLIISEEVTLIETEQIEIACQCFKPKEASDCKCSNKVSLLEKELANSKEVIQIFDWTVGIDDS